MKITNKFNLPSAVVNAVSGYEVKESVGDISVTELIGPPMIRQLRKQHDEEIEQDVSDMMWVLLGNVSHTILEKGAGENDYAEKKGLTAKVNGWTLTGRPDLLESNGTLTDYKVTSVWSFLNQEREEWSHQLNVYRWLYLYNGFSVKKMQIMAILRDWRLNELRKCGGNYPLKPFVLKEITIDTQVFDFIVERIKLHQRGFEYTPICSSEERWQNSTRFAVTKVGALRATRVFDIESQAVQFVGKDTELYKIQKRPGLDVRCQDYCLVKKWCEYGSKLPSVVGIES